VGKFVFVGGGVSFVNAMNTSLANYDWLVTTEYTYVENCVSRSEDGFVLGSPPYDTVIEEQNAAEFAGIYSALSPPPGGPKIGAISEAGQEAQVGWIMGNRTEQTNPLGLYGYNNRSFFPGQFLDDDLVND
jgi:hypothetical protein